MFAAIVCHTIAYAVAFAEPTTVQVGPWRAWLECPGGSLPFQLDVGTEQGRLRAWIVNGKQRLQVPTVTLLPDQIVLDMDYYDAKLTGRVGEDGRRIDGVWTKTGKGGTVAQLPFHAVAGRYSRFATYGDRHAGPRAPGDCPVAGRWSVDFSSSDEPVVATFECQKDGTVTGTFLTTTGDYGFLAGDLTGDQLRLSTFDGAHAFLFVADLESDGTLKGDFWSRDTWHETWTARRNEAAKLPDSFTLTQWNANADLSKLSFPDPDGTVRSLGGPDLRHAVRLVEVFGTWCPNCADANRYLVELDRRYRDRGLRVVGLAFELTGDAARDARQVRRYVDRFAITFPVLIAGAADKEKVIEALPMLDKLRAYPTTLFVDRSGRIRYVHTGFSGPATGEENARLRAEFERRIEELLRATD